MARPDTTRWLVKLPWLLPTVTLVLCGAIGFTPWWLLLPAWVVLAFIAIVTIKMLPDRSPWKMGWVLMFFPMLALIETAFPHDALRWMGTLRDQDFSKLINDPSTWAFVACYFAIVSVWYASLDQRTRAERRP